MIKLLTQDKITSSGPPDETDPSRCLHCTEPVLRVVTVTSGAGALRRTPLCGEHFVEAVIQFPVIVEVERKGA